MPDRAPARRGAVLISDPLAIRARRFTAVFVCGLQEGEFPLATAPEPFLSDERRRELAACSGLRLAPADDALARERYLFYACISRATARGRAQLSQLRRGGQPRVGVAVHRRRRRAAGCRVARPPAPAAAGRRSVAAGAGADRARARAHRGGRDRAAVRRRSGAAALAVRQSASPRSPQRDPLRRRARDLRRLPGQMAGGARAPAGAVRARPRPDRAGQLHARGARGGDPAAGERGHGRVAARRARASRRRARGVLAADRAGRSEAVRAAALRAIEADLRRYLRHEAGDGSEWEPRGLELRFGFEGEEDSLPALELGQRPGTVRVRGRDRPRRRRPRRPSRDRPRLQERLRAARVSRAPAGSPSAGCRSPCTCWRSAICSGSSRSPACTSRWPAPTCAPAACISSDADVGSRLFGNDARDEQELRAVLEDATARAVALAARLRAGELTPCPQNCSRDGCRYPGICRSQ